MSAKNRAGGSSIPHDHYPTPKAHILAVLPQLDVRPSKDAILLDPCSGEGAVLEAARECGYDTVGIELQGHLADAARGKGFTVLDGDALSNPWPSVPLVVTNPPFTHADAFVEKGVETVRAFNGEAAFLLRLDWMARASRAALFARVGKPDVFMVPRPSFCMTIKCKCCADRYTLPIGTPRPKACRNNTAAPGFEAREGQLAIHCPGLSKQLSISTTDAAEYAWMVWGPSRVGRIYHLSLPVASEAA